ncbi:MAG: hypothetical protein QOI65_2090 [Thermoleophilaceae bacterium]|nr:hypothetical protein [Thermoleophilaceae bacterium]
MPAVSAVLIPSDVQEPVRRITVGGLHDLQAAVGGDIEAVDTAVLGDQLTSYINAEGKLNGCQPNPRATQLLGPGLFAGDWIAGPLLVCGFDPAEGENRDCPAGFEAEFLGVPRPLARPDHRRAGDRSVTYAWDLRTRDDGRRELAVLHVGYRLDGPRAHEFYATVQNETARDPARTIVRRGLGAGGGIILCREEVSRFTPLALERFAELALDRLGGLYGHSDPRVTRYFRTMFGASLGAVL